MKGTHCYPLLLVSILAIKSLVAPSGISSTSFMRRLCACNIQINWNYTIQNSHESKHLLIIDFLPLLKETLYLETLFFSEWLCFSNTTVKYSDWHSIWRRHSHLKIVVENLIVKYMYFPVDNSV